MRLTSPASPSPEVSEDKKEFVRVIEGAFKLTFPASPSAPVCTSLEIVVSSILKFSPAVILTSPAFPIPAVKEVRLALFCKVICGALILTTPAVPSPPACMELVAVLLSNVRVSVAVIFTLPALPIPATEEVTTVPLLTEI